MRTAKIAVAAVFAAIITASCTSTETAQPSQTSRTDKAHAATLQDRQLAPIAGFTTPAKRSPQIANVTPTPVHEETTDEQPTPTISPRPTTITQREEPTARPTQHSPPTLEPTTQPTRSAPPDRPANTPPRADYRAEARDWAKRRAGRTNNWFTAGLSDDERGCFPQSVRTNQDVKDYLEYLDDAGQPSLKLCLTERGQLGLYMLQTEASGMSGSEEACMWQAARVADLRYTPETNLAEFTEQTEDETEADRTAEIAIIAYCTRERTAPQTMAEVPDSRHEERRRILICLVERIGGPARFMAANLADNTLLGEIAQARRGEGPCGKSR